MSGNSENLVAGKDFNVKTNNPMHDIGEFTEYEKRDIAKDLREYVTHSHGGVQNAASRALVNVSQGVISRVLSGDWDSILNRTWMIIKNQVCVEEGREWKMVPTQNFLKVKHHITEAKKNALTFAIIGSAGCGKTEALKYLQQHDGLILVRCEEGWHRKKFLEKILEAMHDYDSYGTALDMIENVKSNLLEYYRPVIALDEADKLSDTLLYYFITLYNHLEGRVGICLLATSHLRKRIEKGVRLNRKGYSEIYSRLGRRFIELKKIEKTDVQHILTTNGIEDPATQNYIFNDSQNDLRRVKKLALAHRRKMQELQKGGEE